MLCRSPHMQAVLMVIHVITSGRVVLDNAIVLLPKQVLNLAHFLPGGRSVWQAHRYMLPTLPVACNHFQLRFMGIARHKKQSIIASGRTTWMISIYHTVLFRHFKHSYRFLSFSYRCLLIFSKSFFWVSLAPSHRRQKVVYSSSLPTPSIPTNSDQ